MDEHSYDEVVLLRLHLSPAARDDLDEIASGSGEAVPWLNSFYFGEGGGFGLKELVGDRSPTSTPSTTP